MRDAVGRLYPKCCWKSTASLTFSTEEAVNSQNDSSGIVCEKKRTAARRLILKIQVQARTCYQANCTQLNAPHAAT